MKRLLARDSIVIDAPPERAFQVITDPPLMASLAREIQTCRWIDGEARGIGARFVGQNANGRRRWRTECTVVDLAPDRCFAYHVATIPFGIPVSRWQYDIDPLGRDGCTVTESNWLRLPLWFVPAAIVVSGTVNRPGLNNANIAATLRRLKEHLESAD